jgi:prepilin-type processing-associated H-X9-DG protein
MKIARRRVITLAALCGAVLVIAIISVTIIGNRAYDRAMRSNALRSLGQAILLYRNDNHGMYPPDWGALAAEEDITAQIFVYPRNCTAPANMTLNQLRDWVNHNSHFAYIARELPNGSDEHVVLAYDKPGVDSNGGMNILFQDGHVCFFDAPQAAKIVKQLQSNVNPPVLGSEGRYVGTK